MTTNKQSTIGFGLVGAGMIANYHAKAIQALSKKYNVRLVGVLGFTEDEARNFAEKNDIPYYTNNSEEFFARKDIQVVCVVTPSGAHLEPALMAIKAGKHIIVEKPLEITVERVDTMLRAAKEANVKIAPIFQARLSEGAQAVKRAIDTGRFGRLSLCSAYVKWYRSAEYYRGWKGTLKLDGGGAVMNQAIHAVDLLQYFAGLPQEVFAWKTKRIHLGIEAEDTACATFKFPSGSLGVLEATTAAYPGWERRIEICGEFGSAVIEDDRILRWEFKESKPEDAELLKKYGMSDSSSGAGAPDQISVAGHQKQIEDMILSLQNNALLLVDGNEARKTVALVCAIYESAEKGIPVTVA